MVLPAIGVQKRVVPSVISVLMKTSRSRKEIISWLHVIVNDKLKPLTFKGLNKGTEYVPGSVPQERSANQKLYSESVVSLLELILHNFFSFWRLSLPSGAGSGDGDLMCSIIR